MTVLSSGSWREIERRHGSCSPGVEKLLVYFLLLEDGSQTMLTPAELEQRFGWKNDPSMVPHLPGMEASKP